MPHSEAAAVKRAQPANSSRKPLGPPRPPPGTARPARSRRARRTRRGSGGVGTGRRDPEVVEVAVGADGENWVGTPAARSKEVVLSLQSARKPGSSSWDGPQTLRPWCGTKHLASADIAEDDSAMPDSQRLLRSADGETGELGGRLPCFGTGTRKAAAKAACESPEARALPRSARMKAARTCAGERLTTVPGRRSPARARRDPRSVGLRAVSTWRRRHRMPEAA